MNGARRPPEFYLLDRATGKAIQIGSTYPGLDESRLGEIKPYSYKARDGLDIHAYLTLPPGRVPHKLPAVILPHGGPGERDQMQFAWLPQFLATRGYAVLQPNFRGSTGYGAAFREGGFGEWGRAMQNDVTDGVRKLIRDGIVDAGRICIVGASYGGYAALAGAAFTPELYACAAVWAPVTDPKRFLASRAAEYGLDSAPYSSWAHSIEGNGADLDAVSPLRQAARIRCPVLMLHGTSDSNVPVEQSRLMAEALRGAGKDVEYLEIERENHFLDDAGARVRFLTELERFLAAHIGT